jgi:glycine/D-amino acid oxidase-like deaminating enzyme
MGGGGTDCDVVVVGAGLAGLACARVLTEAGLDVHVWESEDAVGGRVRTDRVDGFLLDRGFQVLNTAYPEARRALDLDGLALRRFDRAMLLHHDGTTTRLADPFHEPTSAPLLLRAPVGGVRGALSLAAYGALATALPAASIRRRADVSAEAAWRAAGLAGEPTDTLLRPFFAGVLLEEEMSTSRRFVDLMLRMFARGWSAVPAAGMQAMPEQLAGRLPAGRLHLGAPVRRVLADRVDTDAGAVRADAVVVATDADAAAALLPGRLRPTPPWKGVTTLYHAAPEPPLAEPTLLVDADPSPVDDTVVLTAAAPSYSSDGRALVATSLVHGSGAERAGEPVVRQRLGTLYRTDTSGWEHVATYVVDRAQPAMPPPHPMRRPVRCSHEDGTVYVCGDHRDTSSIQGALVSGRRAAEVVLADHS